MFRHWLGPNVVVPIQPTLRAQVFGRNKPPSSFEVCLLTSLMYETRGCSPRSIESRLNDPSRWFCNRFFVHGESHRWWHGGDSAYLVYPSRFISITLWAQMSYFSPSFFPFPCLASASLQVIATEHECLCCFTMHLTPVPCSPAPQLWPMSCTSPPTPRSLNRWLRISKDHPSRPSCSLAIHAAHLQNWIRKISLLCQKQKVGETEGMSIMLSGWPQTAFSSDSHRVPSWDMMQLSSSLCLWSPGCSQGQVQQCRAGI